MDRWGSSWRDDNAMASEDIDAFIAEHWSMVIGTVSRDRRPHLVTMAYGLLDGAIVFTTYGRSQKVTNLTRDPRITCLIEDVGTSHEEIRGVQIVATAELSYDPAHTLEVLRAVKQRSTLGQRLPDGASGRASRIRRSPPSGWA